MIENGERVWHREFWDRFIRDKKQFEAAIKYIEQNPVKADGNEHVLVNAESGILNHIY